MGNAQIGARIREIRKAKGVTATFMARKLGYKTASGYTRIESGESPVTLEKAAKIADILGVDVNEFRHEQNLRDSRKRNNTA